MPAVSRSGRQLGGRRAAAAGAATRSSRLHACATTVHNYEYVSRRAQQRSNPHTRAPHIRTHTHRIADTSPSAAKKTTDARIERNNRRARIHGADRVASKEMRGADDDNDDDDDATADNTPMTLTTISGCRHSVVLATSRRCRKGVRRWVGVARDTRERRRRACRAIMQSVDTVGDTRTTTRCRKQTALDRGRATAWLGREICRAKLPASGRRPSASSCGRQPTYAGAPRLSGPPPQLSGAEHERSLAL